MARNRNLLEEYLRKDKLFVDELLAKLNGSKLKKSTIRKFMKFFECEICQHLRSPSLIKEALATKPELRVVIKKYNKTFDKWLSKNCSYMFYRLYKDYGLFRCERCKYG